MTPQDRPGAPQTSTRCPDCGQPYTDRCARLARLAASTPTPRKARLAASQDDGDGALSGAPSAQHSGAPLPAASAAGAIAHPGVDTPLLRPLLDSADEGHEGPRGFLSGSGALGSAPATPLRVLVACEFSGIVRDAFIAAGHDAMSCDLLPSERPGPHHIGDVRELLGQGWDLMIAHPPCTYLSNAGVRHLHSIPSRNGVLPKVHGEERWAAMRDGAELFRDLLAAPIPRIAVENPIMHKYAVTEIGRRQDQVVQPWQFGEPVQKAVALWLVGLPPLLPTGPICEERHQLVHKMSPSADRAKKRSRFFPGIAAAMAAQWGTVAVERAA